MGAPIRAKFICEYSISGPHFSQKPQVVLNGIRKTGPKQNWS